MMPKANLRALRWVFVASCVVLPASRSFGQCASSTQGSQIVLLGTAAADSLRFRSLTEDCAASGSLIRSSLTLSAPPDTSGRRISALGPWVSTTWNSALPDSRNDGATWSGRGVTVSLLGGVRADVGRLRLVAAPHLFVAANKPFPLLPSAEPSRSAFASPFHSGIFSADLPLRFGTRRYVVIDPGETTVELVTAQVAFGLTSAPQ